MGFYFDIFPPDFCEIPLLSVPMRIDNITNGYPTYLTVPNREILEPIFQELGLEINFHRFFTIALRNEIAYARKKYKEITLRTLQQNTIEKWFQASLEELIDIPDLTRDFSWILGEFLKCFHQLEENNENAGNNELRQLFTNYCERVVEYFQNRIAQNEFHLKEKGKLKLVHLFAKKKDEIYPITFDVIIRIKKSGKRKKMTFVPYFIYEDMVASFTYNLKLLAENKAWEFNPHSWIDLHIIKYIKTFKQREKLVSPETFDLSEIKISEII